MTDQKSPEGNAINIGANGKSNDSDRGEKGKKIPVDEQTEDNVIRTEDGRIIYPNAINVLQQTEHLLFLMEKGKLDGKVLTAKLREQYQVGSIDGFCDAIEELRRIGIINDEDLARLRNEMTVAFTESDIDGKERAYRLSLQKEVGGENPSQ